ncbi:TLC domain [Seminavis robusta]|uniref:TLC domain n=1 Tax=Seminavis robusta TaxID=568900 RepID=A0A9N8DS49_9STRA|nr:TLC domain [Seminavis robusta]|eukprot:Sro317_g115680.1 TLC domain (308) ;mRNA; r:8104-9027
MCNPSVVPSSATTASSMDHNNDGVANKELEQQVMPPSGFERYRRWIEGGLLALSVCYGCVYHWNPPIPLHESLCQDQQDGFVPGMECYRPDLVAYKVTSFLAMATMGFMGAYHWHFSSNQQLKHMKTPQDRLFGRLPAADYLNVVIFCYQVWDFVVSITIPEHLDPVFLLHHVLAMITAYCSLEYQMMPYYSIFYGGCSEVSSIFLIFIDPVDFFLPGNNSMVDTWVLACQGMFVLSFTAYRIVGWIYYSFPLWRDCRHVMATGQAEQLRPGKTFVLRLFLGLDVVLGSLQCFWLYQIIKLLAGMFS